MPQTALGPLLVDFQQFWQWMRTCPRWVCLLVCLACLIIFSLVHFENGSVLLLVAGARFFGTLSRVGVTRTTLRSYCRGFHCPFCMWCIGIPFHLQPLTLPASLPCCWPNLLSTNYLTSCPPCQLPTSSPPSLHAHLPCLPCGWWGGGSRLLAASQPTSQLSMASWFLLFLWALLQGRYH